ncbi:hypothetical protein W97_07217 [Coniosporium apollinis CBS 100218]|uniref:Uncharacterized protein n=1 Tax=Coniosporium apollinis (strain CBS 100218) TaxID=1168221 RepID=R7Z206_CONA1|nr:uncharacterized protein W97_07217 [Coniosporium apollinis CBS 100218]EON68069.1 hypothetical protein W97_07217 [Coniosporium apollinis CBS 100218]
MQHKKNPTPTYLNTYLPQRDPGSWVHLGFNDLLHPPPNLKHDAEIILYQFSPRRKTIPLSKTIHPNNEVTPAKMDQPIIQESRSSLEAVHPAQRPHHLSSDEPDSEPSEVLPGLANRVMRRIVVRREWHVATDNCASVVTVPESTGFHEVDVLLGFLEHIFGEPEVVLGE